MIIGRRASFESEFERVKLEANLPRWITLATYDEVLGRALQWKGLASAIKDRTEHD